MTRKAMLGAVVVALFLITSGLSGVGGATITDAGEAADASAAVTPNAQVTDAMQDDNETTTEEANGTENETASVTFEDQQSNGSAVVVNETNLSDGGFVVILDDDGAMLGNSSYLEPGVHENLTVELNTTINETQVLVAVPHLDTNGNETFDYNATRAAEIGEENATDHAYLSDGATLGSTAYVTVGNDTSERDSNEARRAFW
jgi:hypothetical protein